jgi:hypothetical protein
MAAQQSLHVITPPGWTKTAIETRYRWHPGELPTDLFVQFDLWRATTTPPNATTVRNIAKIKKN